MKRMIILAAAVLLTGCAARESADRAAELQEAYAAMEGFAARVEVAVARADETLRCTLDVSKDGDETRLTVVEPEMLAGIGATVSGDDLKLSYDGIVLDAGGLDPEVSAVNAVDIVLRAAADGWIVERGAERIDDREALRLCFETEHGGGTLRVAIWFDGTDAPIRAEIERDGEILAELRFTDVAFRDTINTSITTKRDEYNGSSSQTDVGGDQSGQSGA